VVALRDLRRMSRKPFALTDIKWEAVLDELEANARLIAMEASRSEAAQVSLEQLQAVIPGDGAYIGWLDSRACDDLLESPAPIMDSRWLYIIRAKGTIQWIPIWEFDSVSARNSWREPWGRHSALLDAAVAWELRVDDDPELGASARLVGERLFGAALDSLTDTRDLVVEFFDDYTSWFPVECLAVKDGTYLGDRFQIAYSPSAGAFVSCRKAPRVERSVDRVLAVADPIYAPGGVQELPAASSAIDLTRHRAATNGDREALDRLPRLPFANDELEAIRASYKNCTTLNQLDASEVQLRRVQSSQHFDIIHFATHALAETPLRQRCALALSRADVDGSPTNDGLVDALEIQLEWQLDADMVVLSGCQTASGTHWFRGEPTGLAGVLLGIGARSVVASMWKVDDLATARLMVRFCQNLSGTREPMSKVAALAEARTWLRTYEDSEGRRPFAHPAYWAGFILLGDPE
jgi:CHAT domain-containing protein